MSALTDHSADAINVGLTPEAKIAIYRQMIRIRAFEAEASNQFTRGHMGGFLMSQAGQEAIPVAVRSLLGDDDHTICGPRSMGSALVAGLSMREGMAELFGKATGVNKGKSGSIGFFAPEHRHWGGYAVAATQTALAAGLAFGLKYHGKVGAVICALGDGAVNQGTFHESLNLASLFGLPVVFLVENNGYAFCTSVARSSAVNGSLAQRAEGYGVDWDHAEGSDIYELRAKLQPALVRARQHPRPTVIEVATYRFEGFSIADANKYLYRTKAEESDRRQNQDPIRLWAAQLRREGILDDERLEAINLEARAEAQDAVQWARESPFPATAAITKDVYSEESLASPGRHIFSRLVREGRTQSAEWR